MAGTAVRRLNDIRQSKKLSYAFVARQTGIAESTLRRWRSRARRHATVLAVPGPKKMAPLDMDGLMKEMKTLNPGRQRTPGAPDLWRFHQDEISRRDFYNALERHIARVREEERLGLWRYQWLKVGVVWAMDDVDFGRDENGRKLYAHNVMDVGSRHIFEPLDTTAVTALEVAMHLEMLFLIYGAPLFVKSDNATNLLRSKEVGDVLAKWGVLPILSPPRYPQYNGVIERSQGMERKTFEALMGEQIVCPREHFRAYVLSAVGLCNHVERPVLGGQHACHVYTTRKGEMLKNQTERREIYDWIMKKKESILSSTAEEDRDGWAVNAAWRSAVEEWLLQNKVIEIIQEPRNVSTHFQAKDRS